MTEKLSPQTVVAAGAVRFGNALPLALIAGPCAMESRDHALFMAEALADLARRCDIGLIYKSSFDKANRSSGGSARGIGLDRALEIFAEVKRQTGLPVLTDDRLIEAGNHFQGLTFGVGDGSLRRPGHWWHLRNPTRPSWGEPYAEQAERMLAAADDARRAADGHEAVLVSHQLPVWTTGQRVEGRHLWHDPRRRQCSLASLTTLRYEDDRLLDVDYSEPAADLLPGANPVPGA